MDRKRLIEKRKVLKSKLRTSQRLSRINDLIQYLNKHGIKHQVHMEYGEVSKALFTYLAIFNGIDWNKIPNFQKITDSSTNERDEVISVTIEKYLGEVS